MLGIPTTAIVYGRHGGSDTFDISFVKETILRILRERADIYFLFAIRPLMLRDIAHPRLICLEAFADLKIKRKFINSCDAMIHAQSLGESYGLSCGEFSMVNKPVIVWNGGQRQEHLRILGDKAIKYHSAEELHRILTSFDRSEMRKRDWRAYSDYTPEKVMRQFDEVFFIPLRKILPDH
jgi:hypothetical protein